MTLITWEDTFKQIDDKVKAFKTMADISAAALKEALRKCDEKDAEIARLRAENADLRERLEYMMKTYEPESVYSFTIGVADHDER